MKQIIIITILILNQNLCFAQNLFFIEENSYPCTESFTLISNSKFEGHNLDVLIAKDNAKGLLVVSTAIMGGGVRIKGKIIVYLDDGSVITCIDRNIFDSVDNMAKTIYYLTDDEINKMKNSNINTIRFSLKCYDCSISSEEGNFTASNKNSGYSYSNKERTDVPSLIQSLWKSKKEQKNQLQTNQLDTRVSKSRDIENELMYIAKNLSKATFLPIRKGWQFDYGFKDGWLLNKFEYIRSLLTYKDFQAMLDYPIYLSGPHTSNELKLNSKYSFGYYNPKFVLILRKSVLSIMGDKEFIKNTKPLLERYGILEFLKKHKDIYEIIQKEPNDFKKIKSDFLEGIRDKTLEDDAYRTRVPSSIDSDYYWNWSETSYYFWVRRDIDNTIEIWISLVNDVLKAYDY